jgi:hypothetical protein
MTKTHLVFLLVIYFMAIQHKSQIHERTIALMLQGIILRALKTSFKPLLLKGGREGVKSVIVDVTVNSKEENS